MSIDEIRERLAEIDDVELCGPASSADVADAQRLFDLDFPSDYLEFLRTFGAGAAGSEEFVGIGGPEHLDVRRVVRRLRTPSTFAPFGQHLVPLSGDGGGNYDCIDLSRSTPTASVVVRWHHAGGTEPIDGLQPGYWNWFLRILMEAT